MADTKLKPCPFCGYAIDDGDVPLFGSNQGFKWGYVECGDCGATGPEVRTNYGDLEEWGASAVKEWNHRVDPKEAADG